MGVSAGAKKTSILALQIVLDRLLKRMVSMKKEEVDRPPQPLPVKAAHYCRKKCCALHGRVHGIQTASVYF